MKDNFFSKKKEKEKRQAEIIMVTEDLNEAIMEMEPKQDCGQVGV